MVTTELAGHVVVKTVVIAVTVVGCAGTEDEIAFTVVLLSRTVVLEADGM